MRTLVLLVAVAALAGAGTAAADTQVPAGFVMSARLSAPASFVAGKPVSVYCAPTQAAIVAVSVGAVSDALGVTPAIGAPVAYLSPQVCSFLNNWLSGKKPSNLYGLAGSIETLAHESEHMRGIRDETDADCAALRAMVPMVTRYFPLHGRTTMHKLMGDAWSFHSGSSAEYTAHPC